MKERLEKFIKTEGLTPSRFAEIMAVQPSSISHLLAGRNKPSYDFIEKILLRFPKLNPDWLLLGKGSMYRSGEPDPTPGREVPRSAPDTFFVPSEDSSGELFDSTPSAPQSAATPVASEPRREYAPLSGFSETTPQSAAPEPAPVASPRTVATPPQSPEQRPNRQTPPIRQILEQFDGGEIERIVVFLKDKTFVDYQPK